MFIDNTKPANSSFLSLAKDTSLIIDKILSNKKLLKLIYYSTRDIEKQPDLQPEQIKSLFEKGQITNIPSLDIDKEKLTYVLIGFDNFVQNAENTYYKNCVLTVKILCHFSDWDLNNFELRPYRIAGELDAMLNQARLTGIGKLYFLSADQNVYDSEYGGVTLKYLVIHGHEDEVNPLV